MAKGINKVLLIGNLGNDPEVRYTPDGKPIGNITLATSEQWKDSQGVKQERTEWHRVVFFNRLAEIVGEYCKKGSKVYIEGSLRTRQWEDKQGNTRYTTEVIASEMQMLDSRGDYEPAPQQYPNSNQMVDRRAPQQPTPPPPPGFDDFDDDIPF